MVHDRDDTPFDRYDTAVDRGEAEAHLEARVDRLEVRMDRLEAAVDRLEAAWSNISHAGGKRPIMGKPRHNFVYLSADLSQLYRFIVTPQICICGLFPSGSLVLPLCGGVAGEAGLE